MEGPACLQDLSGSCTGTVDANDGLGYLLLADAILVVHALFVAFVVLGLVVILIGKPLGWHFVRKRWFRLTHLGAIGIVVLQAWAGMICPLTVWEMELRENAGIATYDGAFVAHWVQELLYYNAPPWVFTVVYTMFGVLVLISWLRVPPERKQ